MGLLPPGAWGRGQRSLGRGQGPPVSVGGRQAWADRCRPASWVGPCLGPSTHWPPALSTCSGWPLTCQEAPRPGDLAHAGRRPTSPRLTRSSTECLGTAATCWPRCGASPDGARAAPEALADLQETTPALGGRSGEAEAGWGLLSLHGGLCFPQPCDSSAFTVPGRAAQVRADRQRDLPEEPDAEPGRGPHGERGPGGVSSWQMASARAVTPQRQQPVDTPTASPPALLEGSLSNRPERPALRRALGALTCPAWPRKLLC